MGAKVVVLEFNELCPALMERFIGEGRLPNFARLRNESSCYITEADESPPYLEPWIQWVTVHTGLTFAQHGVFDLGDGAKLDAPRLWDLLAADGRKVWICGSMNAVAQGSVGGYFLPDPWSTGSQPHPPGLFEDFARYVRVHVQEHTREKVAVRLSDHWAFARFMLGHGLSFGTVRAIIRQLASEVAGNERWRRAVILDKIQWDLFAWVWKRHGPAFSTFFVNSTAHFQHMYWRYMEPDRFDSKPREEQVASYKDAIRFGYEQMDEIVGRCLAMVDADTTIVLATALSQQPCLKYEETGGKIFFRMVNPERLFRTLQIASCEYAPVMSEQFHLYFSDENSAADAGRKLAALTVNGRAVMSVRRNGSEVFAGCAIYDSLDSDAIVRWPGGEFRFFEYFYDCNLVKSGMHHPDGIFWVRNNRRPTRDRVVPRVPLVDIAPSLLALCGLAAPGSMKGRPVDGLVDVER